MDEVCNVFDVNPPTQEDIDVILVDLDANDDGRLSFEEMLPLLHNIIEAIIQK